MFRLKVREVAEYKKISMRQLALRSGVDMRILRNLYRVPTTNTTLETLARLAYVLNCDVSLLVESNPAMPLHLDAPVRVGPAPLFAPSEE